MQPQKRTKRSYTDQERGWVLAQLELNNDNCKGTARVTGVPWETIRTWKRQLDKKEREQTVIVGVVSDKVVAYKDKSLGGFIDQAEIVRDQAIDKLKLLVPQATVASIPALTNLAMALSDRIDRARGIVADKSVVEHKHTIAPSEEWVKALANYATVSREDAIQRAQEIIDVESEEQPLLGLSSAEGEDE